MIDVSERTPNPGHCRGTAAEPVSRELDGGNRVTEERETAAVHANNRNSPFPQVQPRFTPMGRIEPSPQTSDAKMFLQFSHCAAAFFRTGSFVIPPDQGTQSVITAPPNPVGTGARGSKPDWSADVTAEPGGAA